MESEQEFDFFLVLDFEATCDDKTRIVNEIIEFPTVAVNAKTLKIECEFHKYVRPSMNPKLTEFCTQLTGIQQEWVDKAASLKTVLEEYEAWITKKFSGKKLIWITCGDWDLRTMLPTQCRRDCIPLPSFFRKKKFYDNIKKSFSRHYKQQAKGMSSMLKTLKIELTGRHHSGIDDCRNTAKIAIRLVNDGYVFTLRSLEDLSQVGKFVSVSPSMSSKMGRLCLSIKPTRKLLRSEKLRDASLIVSILKKREGRKKFKGLVLQEQRGTLNSSCELIEVPVFSPKLEDVDNSELKAILERVKKHLEEEADAKVVVFCNNAKWHSPKFAYYVLRLCGVKPEECLKKLKESRWKSVEIRFRLQDNEQLFQDLYKE